MKNRKECLTLLILSVFLCFISSCKKDETKTETEASFRVPTLNTMKVRDVTMTSIKSGIEITSDGGSVIIERGLCWSLNQLPTINDGKVIGVGLSNIYALNNLQSGTTYYVRGYAINSIGVGYGNVEKITTAPNIIYGSVSDVDGNIYKTVNIGSQKWMAENLRTTKFNDNSLITKISDSIIWFDMNSSAYCLYNEDPIDLETYGLLYNWYAVNTGKLCPVGWHVPSEIEWNTLFSYIGESQLAGAKLKEAGVTHWKDDPKGNATNQYGFTALPAGVRTGYQGRGVYQGRTGLTYWWSSTGMEGDSLFGICKGVQSRFDYTDGGMLNKKEGMSIRCLKN